MVPEDIIGYKFQQKNKSQKLSRTSWKPSLLWILLSGAAILLIVEESFTLFNNNMNLFYPHDNLHVENLDGPENNDSGNDGSNLPVCQRTDRFITFHDVYDEGYGLLHKTEEFVAALKMAILTNRTLIDYAPSLARRCNLDVNGHKRQTDNSTSFLWKFSDIFDLSNLHFAYWTENEEHNCRLSVLTDASDEIHLNSVLKFEFGSPSFREKKAYFIDNILSNWEIKHQRKIRITPMFTGKPPFSKFFLTAAEGIKRQCMMSTIPNSGTRNFYVIQLRGTDRPCVLAWWTSSYLIRKIESFNITKNDVIYVMTDVNKENDKLTALKQYFGDSLFMASDMEIFSKSPFKEDNYVVFATELALQKISDGFLSTYKTHEIIKEENELGKLMQRNCYTKTVTGKSQKQTQKIKSIYQRF